MKATAFAFVIVMVARSVSADILEWRDADGVRHYTNVKDEVPKEQRDSAQVLIDEQARSPQPGQVTEKTAAPAAAVASAPEPQHLAEVIYDRSELAEAYLKGLERGLDLARANRTGSDVQINGPLSVATASAPRGYDPSWYPPYGYPLLSTSFDRGRSRYLTLRMLLEDQFALDRDGPFFYYERLIPPFGYPPLDVSLNPFLPRGLPHGFPQQLRVITR